MRSPSALSSSTGQNTVPPHPDELVSTSPKGDPVEHDTNEQREIRAARNQALFRAVNEKLRDLNEALGSMTDEFVVACECADANCVQTLSIVGDEYMSVRANPRTFVVLPGHVYPDVETWSARPSPPWSWRGSPRRPTSPNNSQARTITNHRERATR